MPEAEFGTTADRVWTWASDLSGKDIAIVVRLIDTSSCFFRMFGLGRRLFPMIGSCRCYVFRYDDRSGSTKLCRRCVLRDNDLTGTFPLVRFYRRRMFGYDDLAYLTRSCRRHMFGHHGLTGVFR